MTVPTSSISQPELSSEAYSYYKLIANNTADILMKDGRPDTKIHCNLKFFAANASGSDPIYQMVGFSQNFNVNRLNAELNAKPIMISDNAMYRSILAKKGTKDHLLIGDIDDFARNCDTDFIQPSLAAMRFYKSCLVVAIQGPKGHALSSGDADGRLLLPFGEQTTLAGFICVDANENNVFNDGFDLTIVRQMAHRAFSALHLFGVASAALRTRSGLPNLDLGA